MKGNNILVNLKNRFINNMIYKYINMSLPAKASLWFMITNIINKGISFITIPIFTRLLAQEEYGLLNIYNTWSSIITIFATFQLPIGVFNKAMIKYEDDRDGYTSSSLFLTSLITVTLFFIYLINKKLLNNIFNLNSTLMIFIFIEIFFNTAWMFYAARNKFDFLYRNIVLITIITNFIGTIVSFILVEKFTNNKVEAKIFGMIIVNVFAYGYIYIYILKKGKSYINISYWKYSILYNLPLIPHYLSQQILSQSDRIMISYISGNTDAGLYSLAYQLAILMQFMTNAIHTTFMPWCFQCIQKEDYKIIGKRAEQIMLMVGICCLILSLFAPELIYILGGDNYYSAIYIVPPVSMSVLFLTLYSFFGNIEFYFEKTNLIMIASFIVALSNIILNYLFIPKYGFISAGYTTLICYIGYSIIHYVIMKNICKKNLIENPFSGKKIWINSIIFTIISILISYTYKYIILRYIMITACLFLVIKIFNLKK